jgi:hypothetical protein
MTLWDFVKIPVISYQQKNQPFHRGFPSVLTLPSRHASDATVLSMYPSNSVRPKLQTLLICDHIRKVSTLSAKIIIELKKNNDRSNRIVLTKLIYPQTPSPPNIISLTTDDRQWQLYYWYDINGRIMETLSRSVERYKCRPNKWTRSCGHIASIQEAAGGNCHPNLHRLAFGTISVLQGSLTLPPTTYGRRSWHKISGRKWGNVPLISFGNCSGQRMTGWYRGNWEVKETRGPTIKRYISPPDTWTSYLAHPLLPRTSSPLASARFVLQAVHLCL